MEEQLNRRWVEIRLDVWASEDAEIFEAVGDMVANLGLPHSRELVRIEPVD